LSISTPSIEVRELYVLSTNIDISLKAAPPPPFAEHARSATHPLQIPSPCPQIPQSTAHPPTPFAQPLGVSASGSKSVRPFVSSHLQPTPDGRPTHPTGILSATIVGIEGPSERVTHQDWVQPCVFSSSF
jgi:hypothetical protein